MDGPERPAHYDDLAAVRQAAWDMLVRGALSRKSAFHQATVATVTPDGFPAARTVVLREADRGAGVLRFHTDTRSNKFAELSKNPACVLHFYDHGAKIQVRARGTATLHNEDGVTRPIWDAMADMSRDCYRQPVGPGEALSGPGGADGARLDHEAGYAHFVVVRVAVEALDWLYLAAKGHRRARLTEGGDIWLAP